MLSRKSLRKYKPGDKVTAADKNFMLQEAKSIIVGGRGIDVSNIAGKVNISLRSRQTINKGYFGNVYKLRAETGALQWAFDTGDEAYSVFVTSDAVYVGGKRNDVWGDGGTFANVWKLTLGGSLVWAVDTNFAPGSYTKQDVRCVAANATGVFVNNAVVDVAGVPTGSLVKLDPSDGAYITRTTGLGGSVAGRLAINSTQLWGISGNEPYVRGYDLDLNLGYGPAAPLSGDVNNFVSISCNDTYVAVGLENRRGAFGVITESTGSSLEVTDTSPVLGYSYGQTLGASDLREFQKASVDSDYFLTCYHKTNSTPSNSRFEVRLRECSAGLLQWDYEFDGYDTPLIDGLTAIPMSPALDEANDVCFVGSPSLIEDYGGSTGLDGRCLFAFTASTGALLWTWSPWDGDSATDDSGMQIFDICSDRDGHVYAASRTRQRPSMKVGS